MIELAIAVSVAIVVSAGCSLFEAVLYSLPMRHIEAVRQAGKSSGRVFKQMRSNVERPIAAILSLNTIANTAGAAFAGSAASAVFGHQWLPHFSVFFTLSVLIFSEILPKTAGVVYGRPLMPFVAYPLRWLVWFMTPAIWLSGLLTRLIARREKDDAITANEVRIMAHLSLESGGIRPYQDRTIENILTLNKKTVKDVMTPRTVVFSLSVHLTLEQAALQSSGWEHSRVPVYDENMEDIVGMVLTKELFMALSEGRSEETLKGLMRPVHFVAETARLNRVLTEFLEMRKHLFVVLDEYGGLAGLVSLEDILEEILGREIVDESDEVTDKRAQARQGLHRITDEGGQNQGPMGDGEHLGHE